MPLNLPDKLPAIELLKEENIFVIDNSRATRQDIRPLRIVILNLMPLKITTETDLVRLLSNTPLQVEISFMKIKSHTSKNTPIEHMKAFYTDFDKMRDEKYVHALYLLGGASRTLPPLRCAQVSAGRENVRHIRTSHLAASVSHFPWF